MAKANQKDRTELAKAILDEYRPLIIRKDKVFLRDGIAQVNTNDPEHYEPENYSQDMVLQIPPKDAIVIEFEDEPDRNQRHIAEMEESCRAIGVQNCVTGHDGGKSDYLRIIQHKRHTRRIR